MKKFLPLLALPVLVLLATMITSSSQDSADQPALQDAALTQNPPAALAKNSLAQFTSLWRNTGSAEAEKTDPFDMLWVRVITATGQGNTGGDAEDQLRKLVQEQPYYLKKIISLYEKEPSAQVKEIIRNLLSGIRSPEVFALSRQLASSADSEQRIAGLIMLRNLDIYPQEERLLISLSLNNEQAPAVILQALSALKPPAPAASDAPTSSTVVDNIDAKSRHAIISQLQSLTHNTDPAVRSQSVLQLALWDKNESSLSYFSAALNDPAASVRQTAIFALAQSGINADNVKQLLNGVINNAGENAQLKASAQQILEVIAAKQTPPSEVTEQRKTQT